MAQLSFDLTERVNRLRQQALNIIHEGSAAAFQLNEQFGESAETLPFFEELEAATEDARRSLMRLQNLQLLVAQSQPGVPADVLQVLSDSVEVTSGRIPALERTIEEVKLEFKLS